MSARTASRTALRPATISDPPGVLVVVLRLWSASRPPPDPCPVPLSDDVLRAAGWYGRSEALGVGPRPWSARRPLPPLPTCGPFFDPALRTAPRRLEFPAI